MNNNFQLELNELKEQIGIFSDRVSNVHKLVSLLNKYCKFEENNDDFYEISYLVELIEKKISDLGYDMYMINHSNNTPKTREEILEDIKRLNNATNIVFVDD